MPKICSNYVQMQTRLHMSCIEMDVLSCDWTYDAPKISLVLVWIVTFPLKTKQPLILNLYCPICVELEWNSEKLYTVYGIIITRYRYLVNTRNYPSLTIQFFVRHGPFDIQGGGGGGAWVFGPGQNIFFGQNRSKFIFFAGPSGRIIFFHNRKLHL